MFIIAVPIGDTILKSSREGTRGSISDKTYRMYSTSAYLHAIEPVQNNGGMISTRHRKRQRLAV